MKNLIYFILFVAILFTSCNGDNLSKDIATERLYSPLISEMSNFNDSLMQICSKTRGYRGSLDYTAVACADVGGMYAGGKAGAWLGSWIGHPHVGAGIGALVVGAYSSYRAHRIIMDTRAGVPSVELEPIDVAAAYIQILKDESLISENTLHEIKLNFKNVDKDIVESGPKHNIIVKNLQNKCFAPFEEVKKYLSEDEITILKSDEFAALFDSIDRRSDIILLNNNTQLSKEKVIPDQLMKLFTDILQKYSDKADDVEFIINRYIEAVENTSELSQDDKNIILKSLSVAASSFELWRKQE